MQRKVPDRFYIPSSDRSRYVKLTEKDASFGDCDYKHVFLMALAVGFAEGGRRSLGKKFGYFRTEYLNDEEYSLIKAIAVAEEGNLEVLRDKGKVHTIAEEYAAGGITLLESKVNSGEYGSYIKRLQASLTDAYKKIGK